MLTKVLSGCSWGGVMEIAKKAKHGWSSPNHHHQAAAAASVHSGSWPPRFHTREIAKRKGLCWPAHSGRPHNAFLAECESPERKGKKLMIIYVSNFEPSSFHEYRDLNARFSNGIFYPKFLDFGNKTRNMGEYSLGRVNFPYEMS